MKKIICFSDGVNVRVFAEEFVKLNDADENCEFPNAQGRQSGEKFYYNTSQVVEFPMIG